MEYFFNTDLSTEGHPCEDWCADCQERYEVTFREEAVEIPRRVLEAKVTISLKEPEGEVDQTSRNQQSCKYQGLADHLPLWTKGPVPGQHSRFEEFEPGPAVHLALDGLRIAREAGRSRAAAPGPSALGSLSRVLRLSSRAAACWQTLPLGASLP